jgi:hypothetical protein
MRWLFAGLIASCVILQLAMMVHEARYKSRLHAISAAGEVCVSYHDTWLGPEVDKSWRPRTGGGIDYCPDGDAPPHTGAIGQLLPVMPVMR